MERLEERALLAAFCPNFAADVSHHLEGVQDSLNAMNVALPLIDVSNDFAKLTKSQFIQDAADAISNMGDTPPRLGMAGLEAKLVSVL